MEKLIKLCSVLFPLLEKRLPKSYKLKLEEFNSSGEIKQTISIANSKKNFDAGNKVVLLFCDSKKNIIKTEHHYCLDGKQKVVQNEKWNECPNKLSYCILGQKKAINFNNLLGKSKDVIKKSPEMKDLVWSISDYFIRLDTVFSKGSPKSFPARAA